MANKKLHVITKNICAPALNKIIPYYLPFKTLAIVSCLTFLQIMQDSISMAYILSAILFIFGIKMLGKQQTARSGNIISGIAMLIAIIATLLHSQILSYSLIVIAIIIGTVVGIPIAYRTKMINMPEMVALYSWRRVDLNMMSSQLSGV